MTSRKQDQPTVSRKNIQTVEVQLHLSSWRKIYFWNLNDPENIRSRGTASARNNGPSVRSDRPMEGRTHSCSILNLYNSLESRPETIKSTIQHFIFLWAADLKQTHGEQSGSLQDESPASWPCSRVPAKCRRHRAERRTHRPPPSAKMAAAPSFSLTVHANMKLIDSDGCHLVGEDEVAN